MPTSCPTLETLVAHAFGAADPGVARHLATCPTCQPLVADLHATAAHLATTPPDWTPTTDCFDERMVAAVVDGTVGTEDRAGAVAHLHSCARCRAAVGAVSRVTAEFPIPTTGALLTRIQPRRWVALAAAAAAMVLLLLWPGRTDRGPHRGQGTPATVPVPIAPVGTVARAPALRWASVPGSDRYRVILFDADGRVLYESQVADTVVNLPDSVALVPGQLYLWRAEARTGWDRWAASALVRFSIPKAPPR